MINKINKPTISVSFAVNLTLLGGDKPQLKNCLYPVGLWVCPGGSLWLLVDVVSTVGSIVPRQVGLSCRTKLASQWEVFLRGLWYSSCLQAPAVDLMVDCNQQAR